jgi:cytochrome c oxidase subunit II
VKQAAFRTYRILAALRNNSSKPRLGRRIASKKRLTATLVGASSVIGSYLAFAPSADARCCTLPSGASPNATSIASLYNIIFYIAVVVFLTVFGFLMYSVWAFRSHKNPVASQIHGNTKLELSLTAGAAGILVIIAAVTFIKLPSIINPPNSDTGASSILSASLTSPNPPDGHKLIVCVTGRQFIWRYTYGANCNKAAWQDRLPYTYEQMVAPAGETVDLLIQSSDVIHSWWIPALGGKVDAVPGFTTYTWFKAAHAGQTYQGQCAQLCGREHAYMLAAVKVVTPSKYQQFIRSQTAQIEAANSQVPALRKKLEMQGSLTSNGIF